jgi:hypothetical protein
MTATRHRCANGEVFLQEHLGYGLADITAPYGSDQMVSIRQAGLWEVFLQEHFTGLWNEGV